MHLISLSKKDIQTQAEWNQKVQILYRSRFEFANSLAGTTASRVDICMCTYLCGGRINRKDALIKVDKYVIMRWKQKTKTPYMQTLKLWKNWYSALNGYEGGVNWLLNLLRASKQKPAKEDQQQQNLGYSRSTSETNPK